MAEEYLWLSALQVHPAPEEGEEEHKEVHGGCGHELWSFWYMQRLDGAQVADRVLVAEALQHAGQILGLGPEKLAHALEPLGTHFRGEKKLLWFRFRMKE